jgi:hypothetical protein
MNYQRVSELYAELSKDFSGAVDPVPPPVQPPTGDKIEVLVTFVGINHSWVPPIDVRINGEWYPFYRTTQDSPKWNQALQGSRGKVFEVSSPITDIAFRQTQVFDSNHKDFNYKVGSVPQDADLYNQTEADGANFWARWVLHKADHVSVRGSVSGRVFSPFYHYTNIPADWSDTGKFRIIVSR